MPTRESLRFLVEAMDHDQVEALAELALECGLVVVESTAKEPARWLDAREPNSCRHLGQ